MTFEQNQDKALRLFVTEYEQGQVFAYPTEAVFGLGCDPQNENAVLRILALKQRSVEKGVILIASAMQQILPYVNFDTLPVYTQTAITDSWPGPVTWLLPKSSYTPDWISGSSNMVAVRISNHPLVRRLCDSVGKPLVSTSANPAGEQPAKNASQVASYFQHALNTKALTIIDGELGQQSSPSKIFHSLTMETIRS